MLDYCKEFPPLYKKCPRLLTKDAFQEIFYLQISDIRHKILHLNNDVRRVVMT